MTKLDELSRREFLRLSSVGAAGMTFDANPVYSFLSSAYAASNVQSKQPNCSFTLDGVKSGKVAPQDYLNERIKCVPEAAELQKSGKLKGFLYEPSDEELRARLTEPLSKIKSDKGKLPYLVELAITRYHKSHAELKRQGNVEASIVPTHASVIGKKIPVYVAFTPYRIFHPESNDADVASLIIHELKHVKDTYDGMTLGNIHLSYQNISPKTFRTEFLRNLGELRAEYEELKRIFKERVDTGKVSVSSKYLSKTGFNYAKHWKFIQDYAATELEDKVRKLQFEESKGIASEIKDNKFIIHFDLFGRKTHLAVEGVYNKQNNKQNLDK